MGPGAQRISADRPTVELATLLLAVPLDGLGEDEAQEARRGRFEAVLATARAFAAVCRADPEKRAWWCGKMFSLRARARADGGDPTSRWQAVEEDVAEAELVEAELERGRQAAREHLAAQADEAAKLAAGRVSPEFAAAETDKLLRRLQGETAGTAG